MHDTSHKCRISKRAARLERLIARLRRGGYMYLPQDFPTVEELAGTADHQLFKSIITNPHHVLRQYFPEKKPSGYNLRPLLSC